MNSQHLTTVRLHKEEIKLQMDPIPNAIVVREGYLNFHFCLYHLDSPYSEGIYHGLLELHENYPFAAPKLLFYTPNGRFQTNIPICTSFTNYHQESWTSAWNIRTLILGTISFMLSYYATYGCLDNLPAVRQQLAKSSIAFNLENPKFVKLFGPKLRELNLINYSYVPKSAEYAPNESKLPVVNENNGQNHNRRLVYLALFGAIICGTIAVIYVLL